jgi:hypothetical protein
MLMAVQPISDLACSYKDKEIRTRQQMQIHIGKYTDTRAYLHGISTALREKVPMLELNQGRLKSLPSRRRGREWSHQYRVHPAKSLPGASRLVTY